MMGHHGSQGSFKAAWAMSLDGDSLLSASGTHIYVWEALELTMLNNEPEFSQFTYKAKISAACPEWHRGDTAIDCTRKWCYDTLEVLLLSSGHV